MCIHYMQMLCYLYKEHELLQILVSTGHPGMNPPWIPREDYNFHFILCHNINSNIYNATWECL